ncbi:nucleotidyltransferase domain-containing protein [Tropicimonas sediminicola]|nr:nucleotidyltransferase family protein [Tropicimonas sediminicola]
MSPLRLPRFPPDPSPLRQLAACLRGEVSASTDWHTCLEAANLHYVAPALGKSLELRLASEELDPEALQYLEDLRTLNGERNRRLADQLAELARALNEVGVTPIVIKGAAILAGAPRPEHCTRMLVDLDILVEPSDVTAADKALRGIGYKIFEDSEDEHSSGSYYRNRDVGAVDLHFCLADRIAEVITPEDLATRTRDVPFGNARIRIPDASLLFVMNIAHEMLHDEVLSKGRVSLRYLLDLVDLSTDETAPLDRAWIEAKCAHWKFDLALELQSRMADELLGLPLAPGRKRTRLGALLHRRRLLKAHSPTLDELEWTLIWRFKNLLRAARLDPTPLIARRHHGEQ